MSTRSMSSRVVGSDSEKRMDPGANGKGAPMARKTCDGANEPDVQAEPDEAHTPKALRYIKMDSPSI